MEQIWKGLLILKDLMVSLCLVQMGNILFFHQTETKINLETQIFSFANGNKLHLVFDLENLTLVDYAEVGKQAGGIAFWKMED